MEANNDLTREQPDSYESTSAEYRLRTILESSGAGTWEWNVQTGQVIFNDRWAEIVGYRLHELSPVSTETWISLAHPADLQDSNQALQDHFDGVSGFYQCEVRMRHKDGHWVWVRDHGRLVTRTESGEPEWVNGTHIDISVSKEQEEALRLSRDILKQAQKIGRLGYWQSDLDTGELTWSEITYDIFGVDPETFTPTTSRFYDMIHPDDRQAVRDSIEKAGKTGIHDVKHRIVRPDGTVRWVHELGDIQQSDQTRNILLGTVRDITEQKELEIRLREQSTSDELTGAWNRRYFIEQISVEFDRFVRHGHQGSLILFDFDHFKRVNDRYGHATGDQVLSLSVAVIQQRLRSTDCLARIGGEEFAILLPSTTLEQALVVAETVRESVAEQLFDSDQESFRATITCGVATFRDTDKAFDNTMHRADEAMYRGKTSGRNRVRHI